MSPSRRHLALQAIAEGKRTEFSSSFAASCATFDRRSLEAEPVLESASAFACASSLPWDEELVRPLAPSVAFRRRAAADIVADRSADSGFWLLKNKRSSQNI